MLEEGKDNLIPLTSHATEEARREEERVHQADTSAAGVITLGLAVAGLVTAMVSDASLDDTEAWLLQLSIGLIVLAILPGLVARLWTPLRGRSKWNEIKTQLKNEKEAIQRAGVDVPDDVQANVADARPRIYELWRLRAEQARLRADGKQRCVNYALVILGVATVPLGILAVKLAGTLN